MRANALAATLQGTRFGSAVVLQGFIVQSRASQNTLGKHSPADTPEDMNVVQAKSCKIWKTTCRGQVCTNSKQDDQAISLCDYANHNEAHQISLTCSKHALTSAGCGTTSSKIAASCCQRLQAAVPANGPKRKG